MHRTLIAVSASLCLASVACSADDEALDATGAADDSAGEGAVSYSADAWADNWFAVYIGDQLIAEDSVSITTERSFNAETFSFEATPPFVMSFMLKDYKATDSGLEYIGEPNQQMGDGGFIAQVRRDSDGQMAAVSDAGWKCLVIHQAPLNKECEQSTAPDVDCQFSAQEEPTGWKRAHRVAMYDDDSPAAPPCGARVVASKRQLTSAREGMRDNGLIRTPSCAISLSLPAFGRFVGRSVGVA